ncbi:MAG TPA: DMT family transporter [Rubrobacteraceae bacterium]|nr:DMT family transporter [Rubrobacteraceae bacterium]
MSPKDLAALLLLGVLWGGSFLFIRVAVPALGPFALMEGRTALAAAVLLLCAVVVGRLPKLRAYWRQFLILGAVNSAAPFTLIAFAQLELTASLAAILNSMTVLFTALVAAFWTGEPLTTSKLAGVLIGVAGVAVLVGWDPVALSGTVIISIAAMLVASFFYAVGSTYAKKTFAGRPPLEMAIGQQGGAALVLIVPALTTLPPVPLPGGAPSWTVALCLLGLAVLSTAVAYLLYFRLLTNVGPTSTVTVTFLVPVFGLLFGVGLLGEPFGFGTLAGLAIILVSVALVTDFRFGGAKRPDRDRAARDAAQ